MITSRRAIVKGTMFGEGGPFSVENDVAQAIVKQNHGYVVENGVRVVDAVPENVDTEFMSKVRAHLPLIVGMLQQHGREQMEKDRADYEEKMASLNTKSENVENTSTTSNPTSSQSSQDELGSSETNDELDNTNDTGVDKAGTANATTQTTDTTTQTDDVDEDKIPENFPGVDKLHSNGITKFSEIPRDKIELQKLKDVSVRLAGQISIALEERGK